MGKGAALSVELYDQGNKMLHLTGLSAPTSERIYLMQPSVNMSDLVQRQLRDLTADGYGDIDVLWNSIALSIEARCDEGALRRVFNCAGACVMEKIDRNGAGVERVYDADGITLLSEEIFDEIGDR